MSHRWGHPMLPVLAVVAALLLLGLDHGLPHRYVPDDSAVKCALGMARDAGSGEMGLAEALVPPSGRYTTYPYLLPYLNLAAIGVRFAYGRATGEFAGPGAFADAVFDDASLAWLPARWVSALLAMLLPLATYRAARELGRGRSEGALAALLAGTSLMFVQYAHTTRPWAALVALGAVTLAASLRLGRKRDAAAAALAFGAAALAASTHQLGLLTFGLPLFACALWSLPVRCWLVGGLAGALVATTVGFPSLWMYGSASGAGAIAEPDGGYVQIGGQAFDLAAFGGQHAAAVARSWLAYDPVLVLAGLAGWWWLRRRLPSRGAWLLMLPTAGYVVVFLLYDGTHVRYLMPAVPALALGAAAAFGAWRARAGGPMRMLAVLVLALPVMQAARLDFVLGRTDTRTLAAARLPELVDPASRVAVDGFGSYYGPPVVPTAASLLAVADEVPLNRSEQRVIARAEAGLPELPEARPVVPVARYYRFDSYYPTDYLLDDGPLEIESFMRGRGVDVYVQVDRLPDEARRQPVTDLHAARGRLLAEVSPTGRSAPVRAELPTDMGAAWIDIWRYERPGPWVRIWRLEPRP